MVFTSCYYTCWVTHNLYMNDISHSCILVSHSSFAQENGTCILFKHIGFIPCEQLNYSSSSGRAGACFKHLPKGFLDNSPPPPQSQSPMASIPLYFHTALKGQRKWKTITGVVWETGKYGMWPEWVFNWGNSGTEMRFLVTQSKGFVECTYAFLFRFLRNCTMTGPFSCWLGCQRIAVWAQSVSWEHGHVVQV